MDAGETCKEERKRKIHDNSRIDGDKTEIKKDRNINLLCQQGKNVSPLQTNPHIWHLYTITRRELLHTQISNALHIPRKTRNGTR
jgi:hypothetical protein